MKLTIELLPKTSWRKNLRDVISPYRWQLLSQKVQKESGYQCEICERKKGEGITRLNCHELWIFDNEVNIQKLIGFQALCFECHCAKHIGYTYSQEWIDTQKIIEHFLRVNKISLIQFKKHEKEAYDIWAERSQIEWIIDFGEWSYLVEQDKRRVSKEEKLEMVRDVLIKSRIASNKEIYENLSKTIEISFQSIKKYASLIRKELTNTRR